MPDFIKSDGKLLVNKSLLPDSQSDILEIVTDGNAGFVMPLFVHYQFKKVRFVDHTIWWEYVGWNGEYASDEEVINVILKRNKNVVGSVWIIKDIQIATLGPDKCYLNLPYEKYYTHGINPQNVIRGLKMKSLFNPIPIPANDPNKSLNPANRPIHVGEIHTTDREPEKMTVSELIYILQKLEGDRDVKVRIRHKGLDCSWERDLLMVFQNDGDNIVSLCVDI